MYKILSLIILFVSGLQNSLAQDWEYKCYSGFEYEISDNVNWGQNEPVVTYVEPWSGAYYAGLKVGDIIMEVGCLATYLREPSLIQEWLKVSDENPSQRITIRNFDNYFSSYTIDKNCFAANGITEHELATTFAPYSYESVRNQVFSMPIKVQPMNIVTFDYSDFKSFDFFDDENPDNKIQDLIEDVFSQRGIRRETANPDFYVKYASSIQYNNEIYASSDNDLSVKNNLNCNEWKNRYNFATEGMELFPIVTSDNESFLGKTKLKFEFYERKIIDSTKYTLIWQAEIDEKLSSTIDFTHYQEVYIPLLLMQYPYTKACEQVTFEVQFREYLYTGIIYDKQNMQKVIDIDRFGPAYAAGINIGDDILSIQKKKTTKESNILMGNLTSFIANTMQFRDKLKCFSTGQNCADCMYWDEKYNDKLRKEFELKQNNTVFSYLFEYEYYINNNYESELEFEILSEKFLRKVVVKPVLRKKNTVLVK